MKTFTLFIGILLATALSSYGANQDINGTASAVNSSLNIFTTKSTNDIAVKWIAEYNKLLSGEQISVIESNTEMPASEGISIVNEEAATGAQWKMLLGRNAMVPVINKNNPLISELNHSGVPAVKLMQILENPIDQNWGALINKSDVALKIYIATEADGSSETGLTSAEMIKKVQQDIYALGFCNLSDVLLPDASALIDNIMILPIDKNNNGRLESFENIYSSIEDFMRGVWIGKYPKQLTNSIYAVSSARPSDEAALGFLSWAITDGQNVLNASGYIVLTSHQSQVGLQSIADPVTTVEAAEQSTTSFNWVLILGGIIVLGLCIMIIYSIIKMFIKVPKSDAEAIVLKSLNRESIQAPEGLYYGKSHTWSFMEKDGTVKVGIDDFLQKVTGPMTKIKMKESGEAIRKGEKMLSINHNGKQLDIYAPVSGIIKEQNTVLNNNPSLVNNSPCSDGWIYTIIPKNWTREIEFMLFGHDYKEWLSDELSRLKDFLAHSIKTNTAAYQHIILQDGGELTENVLADLDPKVWDDFQTKFLDISK